MNPVATNEPRDKNDATNWTRSFLLRLEVRSQPTMLCVIRGALQPLLDKIGLSAEDNRAVIRGVDEAVSNIMRHAYRGRNDQPIEVCCHQIARSGDPNGMNGVEILLIDSGPPVDITQLEARPLEEIKPGGLGLHIIRESMDRIEYERAGEQNHLRLFKFVKASPCGAGAEENCK